MSESDDLQELGLLTGTRKASQNSPSPWIIRAIKLALCSVAVSVFLVTIVHLKRAPSRQQVLDRLFPASQRRTWAQYAPYAPVAEARGPPEGCTVSQVNILQRHGARFPTAGAAARILAALSKIQSATSFNDPNLEFLRNYEYALGTDDMVPYGAEESFDSGVEAYWRYQHLVSDQILPFIRSDKSQRDVDSAWNWTAGFSTASRHKLKPVVSFIVDAAARNNTLDGSQCPGAGRGEEQTDQWLATHYPQVTARLNANAPGAELTDENTYNLISLCPFETVAYLKKSPWCTLFESIPNAFDGFEYTGDLDKFYKTGYGQYLGPVQGVGYMNELVARLTESPVRDQTQTNHSVDDFPYTFPLNRTLYLDFSHDNQMIAIFSAMGLFRQPQPLDPTEPDPDRTWRVSAMVPFAGRMVVERLNCSQSGREARSQKMVRILVQDQVQPLEFCGASENGLCTLDAFVDSQAYARNKGEGDWEKCFE
ncbi:phytase [Irpex rosettiformis]|uniref:Phytase n=1 Tax=Irpex rosettiformis TaxID=378272 RepID=A0ACB8U3Z4_9APHY|nr:phytase [Irpex rosettiformis]